VPYRGLTAAGQKYEYIDGIAMKLLLFRGEIGF
jgi:hypothetical protein